MKVKFFECEVEFKLFLLASQKAAYHPSSGYYWKTNNSSGLF